MLNAAQKATHSQFKGPNCLAEQRRGYTHRPALSVRRFYSELSAALKPSPSTCPALTSHRVPLGLLAAYLSLFLNIITILSYLLLSFKCKYWFEDHKRETYTLLLKKTVCFMGRGKELVNVERLSERCKDCMIYKLFFLKKQPDLCFFFLVSGCIFLLLCRAVHSLG